MLSTLFPIGIPSPFQIEAVQPERHPDSQTENHRYNRRDIKSARDIISDNSRTHGLFRLIVIGEDKNGCLGGGLVS